MKKLDIIHQEHDILIVGKPVGYTIIPARIDKSAVNLSQLLEVEFGQMDFHCPKSRENTTAQVNTAIKNARSYRALRSMPTDLS